MEKNIYDILNEVEIDLNEYDREDFTDIEKRKLKKSFKKTIKKNNIICKKSIAAASIAVLIIGLFTTNLGNNVWTYANMIAYDIVSYLGIEKSLDEYKTVVNQSITKNGITVQLNEVVLDDDQLVVSSTQTANEKIGEYLTVFGCVYVNGKRVSSGCSGSAKHINEYTTESVMFYDLEGDFSGDLNIKVVFSDPIINEETKSGDWVFEFKTNGDELKLNTEEILLGYTFMLDNGQKITLEKYTSNNLGQKIYFSKNAFKGTEYDMVLRGHDDLGNEVEFYNSRQTAENGRFELSTIYGNLSDDAKKLSLTPYAVKLPDKSGRLNNDFKKVGEEFTIDLSKK